MNKFHLMIGFVILWMFGSIVNTYASKSDIVSIAQSQIGYGETTGDNCGNDIKKYLNGEEDKSWCAGFVSWVLRQSGIKIKYTLRAKDYLKLGRVVKEPQSGDIIVFWRQNRTCGKGHVGIIELVTSTEIHTIEGNVGKFPAKVKRKIYKRDKITNLEAFVRINRLSR